jgi:hypothetical protein
MRQHFYIHTTYSYYLNIGESTKRQQAASDSHRANGATAKGARSLKGALLRKEHEKFRTVGPDSTITLACQKAMSTGYRSPPGGAIRQDRDGSLIGDPALSSYYHRQRLALIAWLVLTTGGAVPARSAPIAPSRSVGHGSAAQAVLYHYFSPTIGENPRKEVASSLPSTIILGVASCLTTHSCSS